MATVLKPDPFNATLLESPALVVTLEQQNVIKRVLQLACSDSRFAEKAYIAIYRILTLGIPQIPVVTSLSPDTAVLGSAPFNMTVGGTGFNPASQVLFNGVSVPAGFVGPSELDALVDVSRYISAGNVSVAVLNDDILSNLMQFEITATARDEGGSVLAKLKASDDKILESKKAAEVLDRKK